VNRWAVVAIPLMLCLVLTQAVIRHFIADRAFRNAKEALVRYERARWKEGKADPSSIASFGPRLRKAVRLEPQCAEYRSYLGRYYQATATDPSISDGRWVELARGAIKQHEKAVELDPLNGVYRAYLADIQGAMARYFEGLLASPSLSEEERMRASEQSLEYHEKAIGNFEEAILLNRTNKFIQQLYNAYRE
jgi:tetratricopeptide (TPR) repeat protein